MQKTLESMMLKWPQENKGAQRNVSDIELGHVGKGFPAAHLQITLVDCWSIVRRRLRDFKVFCGPDPIAVRCWR